MAAAPAVKGDALPVAPSFDDVNRIVKEVFEEIVGQNAYQHMEAAKWNQSTVESITQRLVDFGRPFKYCVTGTIMQTGLGAGLNVSNTCYWDKTSDSSYSIRWENKQIVAVLSIFAIKF